MASLATVFGCKSVGAHVTHATSAGIVGPQSVGGGSGHVPVCLRRWVVWGAVHFPKVATGLPVGGHAGPQPRGVGSATNNNVLAMTLMAARIAPEAHCSAPRSYLDRDDSGAAGLLRPRSCLSHAERWVERRVAAHAEEHVRGILDSVVHVLPASFAGDLSFEFPIWLTCIGT